LQHELIAAVDTFRGSLSSTEVHPRVIVREALLNNSAAVIFGHNHPSGLAEPSQADRIVTGRLREALALIDVRVLDHIVIGGRDVVRSAWNPLSGLSTQSTAAPLARPASGDACIHPPGPGLAVGPRR